MIDREIAFDPREFVREFKKNYVNLYLLWTKVGKIPEGVKLSTPAQTPLREAELPEGLRAELADYQKRHPNHRISLYKYLRTVNGKATVVVEDERGLPDDNRFFSVSRTLTLNTAELAGVVTELYVGEIEIVERTATRAKRA